MITAWRPLGAESRWTRPAAGDLLARDHAVWRTTHVADVPLAEADRDVWLQAGMPDPGTWHGRPYRVHVEWVGGARPSWATAAGAAQLASITVPAQRFPHMEWHVYPSGRWPACSCCGEPMPCRAELRDRAVDVGVAKLELLAQRLPGCCWACGEPITSRQQAVAYPGDNLDLPGGPEVRIHTRHRCWGSATAYERRWLAVDPRRERILTYPRCGGILVVHADGSSECRSGRGPVGPDGATEPDCRGHLTHDHGAFTACYVGTAYLAPEGEFPGCPRGCRRDGHPGTRTTPRPPRRTPEQAAL